MRPDGVTSGDRLLSIGLTWGFCVLVVAAAAVLVVALIQVFRKRRRTKMTAFSSSGTEIGDDSGS